MLWGSGRRNNGLVARIRGAVLGQNDGLETAGGRRYIEGRVTGGRVWRRHDRWILEKAWEWEEV